MLLQHHLHRVGGAARCVREPTLDLSTEQELLFYSTGKSHSASQWATDRVEDRVMRMVPRARPLDRHHVCTVISASLDRLRRGHQRRDERRYLTTVDTASLDPFIKIYLQDPSLARVQGA